MLSYSDVCNDMNDLEWLDFAKQAFPDVDFTLTELIFDADKSARWRKHSINWSVINYEKGYAYGECHCGAWVQCRTNPAPNQIDIGGSAMGINCGDKDYFK